VIFFESDYGTQAAWYKGLPFAVGTGTNCNIVLETLAMETGGGSRTEVM
jgi:hypothetical protein